MFGYRDLTRAWLAGLFGLALLSGCAPVESPADSPPVAPPRSARQDESPEGPSETVRSGSPPTYAQSIAPVLAAHCVKCHGPVRHEKGLRLDSLAALQKGTEEGPVVVAGNSANSKLIEMISGEKPQMPRGSKRLSAGEVALLQHWIDTQARREFAALPPAKSPAEHWAFQAPRRRPLPKVSDADWPRGPIDTFLLARLESESRAPSPEADRASLLRRTTLDLIGLPPTLEELASFEADDSPDAFERQVDRLLASPHYGEHWARSWLDLARFSDTNGYSNDAARPVRRYRDWVIAALNANMPFDQFSIEQLAGDLLADATRAQKIATGFHRNTKFNGEGGADPEEFRIEAVADRVATTGTVWLGLTLGCARCHDHPNDPITQREYYQLFAFFNNTADVGGGLNAEPSPMLLLSTPEQDRRLAELKGLLVARKLELAAEGEISVKNDKVYNDLLEKEAALYKEIPKSMVLVERADTRLTRILERGDFTRPRDMVGRAVPHVLHSLGDAQEASRLSLARWLASRENPLVGRTAVNRAWEKIFGVGLVATSEDFGIAGEAPSHPELLDYLATEFTADWDFKQLHRRLVTSAAYRQSSRVTTQQLAEDPANRLLARGPRFRLEAEVIRDIAQAASGLLDRRVGGPSIFPPQPEGLWDDTTVSYNNTLVWIESVGGDRHRRGLYTFYRRSAPYPSFLAYDAPNRETCVVRRVRTNTPLQALTTLNDPAFTECAQALAERILREGPSDERGRATFGFRLCAARAPREEELAALLELYRSEYDSGDSARSSGDRQQIAWSVVANVLLNLDATLTK